MFDYDAEFIENCFGEKIFQWKIKFRLDLCVLQSYAMSLLDFEVCLRGVLRVDICNFFCLKRSMQMALYLGLVHRRSLKRGVRVSHTKDVRQRSFFI